MSRGTLTIQLPSRAAWWVKYLANRDKETVRSICEVLLLRALANTPGVDLTKNPPTGEL